MISGNPELQSCERVASPSVQIWRGRLRSRWESLGFDSDMFDLFMRMKGARTRLNLLYALSRPMDRLQLARELGRDWNGIDYHVVLLNKHGLVHEDTTSGRVRMYRVTHLGMSLLRLLEEFEG
jgi:DNA-binding transcriptional ArsR family regulator